MRYDGNEPGGTEETGREGCRPGNPPGYQGYPYRPLAASGAADGQRPSADERESLFFPQRGAGSQDLLQRRGPASDAPGGLPGAFIIGLLNQQSRPRQKFRLDNLNDFCYTGSGSNQNSSVKTLSDRSGFCRNTRLGG